MNYKPLIKLKLDELSKEASDLTFGQLLYSFLRKPMLEQKPDDTKIGWLNNIEDRDFYTALENAIKEELEYKK